MRQGSKINSLQMLRAVAVALVMSIHLTNWLDITEVKFTSPVTSFFYIKSWGAIGVDLFFAISGFIMTIVLPTDIEKGTWKKFLLKRAIRIIPLYYLVSLFTLFINQRHGIPVTNESILKTLFFLPVFDKEFFSIPIVYVGWSLSYEMYFYLLISVFLFFRNISSRNLLIILFILSAAGYLFNPNHALLRFITSPLLLEFAFGILVGMLYKNRHLAGFLIYKSTAIILIIAGSALMLTSMFLGSKDINMQEVIENDNHRAMFRVIIWGVPSAILLLGVVLLERATEFTTPATLILLGDASFTAYLIHIKVYQWYSKLFGVTGLNGTLFIVSAIIVCFAASIVFYKLVERPITITMNRLLMPKNRSAIVAG